MYASDQPLTLHSALYRIAEETVSGSDLPTFYAAMHSIVAQLMFAANFYIALHDAQTNTLSFPYFVDENDPPPPAASHGQRTDRVCPAHRAVPPGDAGRLS